MNFISVLRRSRICKKFVRFSMRSRKVSISWSKYLVSKYFFVNLPSLLFTVFGLIWLNCTRTRFSCTNFVRSVIKELVHAFSCANVELLTHLRSLESTKEARVALGFVSGNCYAAFVISKLSACINMRTLSISLSLHLSFWQNKRLWYGFFQSSSFGF